MKPFSRYFLMKLFLAISLVLICDVIIAQPLDSLQILTSKTWRTEGKNWFGSDTVVIKPVLLSQIEEIMTLGEKYELESERINIDNSGKLNYFKMVYCSSQGVIELLEFKFIKGRVWVLYDLMMDKDEPFTDNNGFRPAKSELWYKVLRWSSDEIALVKETKE